MKTRNIIITILAILLLFLGGYGLYLSKSDNQLDNNNGTNNETNNQSNKEENNKEENNNQENNNQEDKEPENINPNEVRALRLSYDLDNMFFMNGLDSVGISESEIYNRNRDDYKLSMPKWEDKKEYIDNCIIDKNTGETICESGGPISVKIIDGKLDIVFNGKKYVIDSIKNPISVYGYGSNQGSGFSVITVLNEEGKVYYFDTTDFKVIDTKLKNVKHIYVPQLQSSEVSITLKFLTKDDKYYIVDRNHYSQTTSAISVDNVLKNSKIDNIALLNDKYENDYKKYGNVESVSSVIKTDIGVIFVTKDNIAYKVVNGLKEKLSDKKVSKVTKDWEEISIKYTDGTSSEYKFVETEVLFLNNNFYVHLMD